jgi:hypothetical protein
MNRNGFTRRTALRGAVGTLAIASASALFVTPALAANSQSPSQRPKSANGWEIESTVGPEATIRTYRLDGSDVTVDLRFGAPSTILLHVLRRFHYEIDTLRQGDVLGFKPYAKNVRDDDTNYSSGTAVSIRPSWYPKGTTGGFYPAQLVVLRDILAECDGVVRWGGDSKNAADESHFQIDLPPTDQRLLALAAQLRDWTEEPGKGAGSPVDVLNPTRRAEARQLEKTQSR